jgi:hypothetical protein
MTKISALSDIGTSVASNDAFVLVDVSDPTTPNKKIQQQNLLAAGGLLPDGSVGTPGLRFLNDTNVGLYRPTTDALAIVTAGQNRLHITSAGLVGIGTSGPSSQLDVRGSATDFDGLRVLNTNSGSGTQTSAAIRLGITNSFGAVNGIRNCRIQATENNADANEVHLDFYTNSAVGLDQETVKMRLTSGGALGIGTTTVQSLLHLAGPALVDLRFTDTGEATDQKNWVWQTGTGIGAGTFRLRAINDANTSGENAYLITKSGTSIQTHQWLTGGSERARIDSSGRLLVGTPSARANFYNSTNSAHFQIEGSGSNDNYALSIVSNYAGNTSGAQVILAKSGGSSVGDNTLVSDGNTIGQINFQGADGTEFVEAAKISAEIDGTPGANDMPGRLVFSTTADGAASPTERLRITSTGQLRLAGAGITFNGDTATANELDDYEEGTWTPSVGGDATYNSRSGTYTKIGRFVHVTVNININTLGTGSSTTIASLPFVTSDGLAASNHVGFWSGTSRSVTSLMACTNTNEIVFTDTTTAATGTNLNAGIMGNGTDLRFTLVYRV